MFLCFVFNSYLNFLIFVKSYFNIYHYFPPQTLILFPLHFNFLFRLHYFTKLSNNITISTTQYQYLIYCLFSLNHLVTHSSFDRLSFNIFNCFIHLCACLNSNFVIQPQMSFVFASLSFRLFLIWARYYLNQVFRLFFRTFGFFLKSSNRI